MIVAIDANVLVTWSTGGEDDLRRARLAHLLQEISIANGRLVIPMPCFAEFLVRTDEASAAWMEGLERKKSVVLAPLDRRAAFECALFDRAALGAGDKRSGRKEPWQKIKVDRQIVAIAKVAGVSEIITDDAGLRSTALTAGLRVRGIDELPVPESARQQKLPFEGRDGVLPATFVESAPVALEKPADRADPPSLPAPPP